MIHALINGVLNYAVIISHLSLTL